MSALLERILDTERVDAVRIDKISTFPVTTELIAELKAKYTGLTADTPKQLEECRTARAKVRSLRTEVEKHRETLKAPIIKEGKRIDEAAKAFELELRSIEDPLDKLIKADEAKKEAIRKAKEEEERARIEAGLREKQEAEDRKRREEREAEEAKLKAERDRLEADRKRLEAEKAAAEAEARAKQAKIDAENAERQRKIDEQQKAEREKLEAERRKIEEEKRAIEAAKQKAEREEFERQTKLKAEKDAADKAEAAHLAKEKADADHRAWQESERVRIEAIKPDVSKVHDFARAIRSLTCPGLKSNEAQQAVHTAMTQLSEIAEVLAAFQPDPLPY